MTYLRAAVEKQKELLINRLVMIENSPYNIEELSNKTISELLEYDEFSITKHKCNSNSLRFTRSIHIHQHGRNTYKNTDRLEARQKC